MPQVKLLRRMGQNPAGAIRSYSDSEAEWLVNNGHAVYVGSPTIEQPAPAEPVVEQQHDDPPPPAATLAELQAEATRLKLPTYGTKAQIADRIDQHKATLAQDQGDEDDPDLEDDLDEDDDE